MSLHRDLNAELEKNNKEIIEQQVLAVMRQETDAMGMGIAENLIKLEKAKNELIHKQIGIIKNLIEVRKADIEIIQLNEHAILSLGETEVKVLEKTMAVHKEYAMFAKIAARDLEIIREEARVKELEANEKHNKDLKNLEEQRYSHNLAELKSRNYNFEELDKMSNENKMNLAKASGRELLGELAKSNKAAFAINKAFAIKDAIVSTAQGITAALKMGPFGIPLAVMIGGLGAVQIATIAKQEYTGRQLGGKVNKGQPYMVGESGREMFVPNQSGNIVPNHDLKQGVNVNFNINTVDASGFNQLLVNSRGVIINMINSAVNEKGRAAII